MHARRWFATLSAVLAVSASGAADVNAQARSGGGAAAVSACTVLSVQEIKTLLGDRTPRFIDMIPPNEEPLSGGGSECFIASITIQLDAVPVARYTQNMQTYAGRTTYERVTGIGDEAHFYEQDAGKDSHVVGIYARVGQHVLVVSMDVEEGDTPASLRPSLMTLSRAAEAKLR